MEMLTHTERTLIGLIGTSGPRMPHTTPSEPDGKMLSIKKH